jgi:predicted anti-sigma-YlaC factor YlaD
MYFRGVRKGFDDIEMSGERLGTWLQIIIVVFRRFHLLRVVVVVVVVVEVTGPVTMVGTTVAVTVVDAA